VSEWRQFRILLRASRDRLLDTAVASRGIDAAQFAIWSFALAVTPPLLFAMRMMNKYFFMSQRPAVLERVALADRLFFVVYAMIAAAFLAAMLWDALFPDRDDQEIVGVLPVRPRTLAAARLTAALAAATAFSAGIALLPGIVYMSNVAVGYRAASVIGSAPTVFIAHIVAVTLAGLFTFACLLALRAIAVLCLGAQVAQRAAAILQFAAVVALLESLVFLPDILDDLASEASFPGAAGFFPPVWFMGLYAAIGGPPIARVPGLAGTAVAATGAALLFAAIVYLAPAAWNARRTLEQKLKTTTGRSAAVARRLASPFLPHPAARAVFGFTLASLTRSRRHALKIATYAAVGVALCAIRYAAAYVREVGVPLAAPADHLLALPLVMTFFLLAALRSAFAIPTDVGGNWTFRVAHPRSAETCVNALGVVLVVLAVLPVTLVWLLATASLWTWWEAAAASAMHAASGFALAELALIGCRSIPFTRAHVAAVDAVRVNWIAGLAVLHLFAFRLDDVQLAALRSGYGVPLYVGAMAGMVAVARAIRRSQRWDGELEFDAPAPDAPAALNLSQAAG
jgi:hypothetical protein